ncbi:MAG: hypothetical protein QF475_00030 [Candidatus Undinarchaeales archaeon]|jgi:phage shock protein A|nr:hypothetical protein [Candidatus Undinarchaeales archaeon]
MRKKTNIQFDEKNERKIQASEMIKNLRVIIDDDLEEIMEMENEADHLDGAIDTADTKLANLSGELLKIKKRVELFKKENITEIMDDMIEDAEEGLEEVRGLASTQDFEGAVLKAKKTLKKIDKQLGGRNKSLRNIVIGIEQYREAGEDHPLNKNH